MIFSKMKIGDFGEEITANYMKDKGMIILARNYFSKLGEIDIIAMDGDILVFTEVKTRTNKKYGSALEAITKAKLLRILKTAEIYMKENDLLDFQVRVDASEVYIETNELNYLENVYPY